MQSIKKEKNEELQVKYKNPSEYEKYIRKSFECMKTDEYQVDISPRLYYRATKDKKIGQWLEENLNLLPYCMKSLQDIIIATGGFLMDCTCHMNNYNNISTEIYVTDELNEQTQLCSKMTSRSVIRTTSVYEIEQQAKYNSIFWTPEIKSAGFRAKV
ncbi:MAG: hypothetical protein J6D08_07715 [Lachnospiraceae bacterium]|nr:hypothetical protein [Lachnospiraceae bacterium]